MDKPVQSCVKQFFLVIFVLFGLTSQAAAEDDDGIVRYCVRQHGFEQAVLDCIAHHKAIKHSGEGGRIAYMCAQRHGGDRQKTMKCIVNEQSGPEAQLVFECVEKHRGFNNQTGTCIAFKFLMKDVNQEAQTAAACVAQYGVSKMAVACAATQLTIDEFEKCRRYGIGGAQGCLGPNNTARMYLESSFAAAQRESGFPQQVIRFGWGVSVGDIQRHGLLGGQNSDARRACDAVAGVFGRRC